MPAIPLTLQGNLDWRAKTLSACDKDPKMAAAYRHWCSQDILFWLAGFAWTESFFFTGLDGITRTRTDKNYPMIIWPAQQELVLALQRAIHNGESLLVEKSREVGASWCVLLVYIHEFLFSKTPRQFSLLSLKEGDVDSTSGDISDYPWGIISDPSTLLGKIDYCIRRLPVFMIPKCHRKRLHLVNLETRSRIDGGASGAFALASQRRDSLCFDEFAKTENAKTIWEGTADVSRCRIVISTPIGLGTFFTELRNSGTIPVRELGWWMQPDKSFDLEAIRLADGSFQLVSTWYRNECSRRTATDIAQNLDIKHLESGATFFPSLLMKTYIKNTCHPALLRVRIDFRNDVADSQIPGILAVRDVSKVRVVVDKSGPWRLWFNPQATPNYPVLGDELQYSPAMNGHLIFGIDVSFGTGASNSVISVFHKLTRCKVAEFADANTSAAMLAKLTCAAALWFGQSVRPLIIPEVNGLAGFDYMRQLSRVYKYSNLYTEKQLNMKVDRPSQTLGFHSSKPRKAAVLGNLKRAYEKGNFTNPSKEAVEEALNYIIFESGAIGPACLVRESADAAATHGDRVIADALALWPGNEQEAYREEKRLAKEGTEVPKLDLNAEYPYGSLGWRMKHKDTVYLDRKKGKSLNDLKPGERFNMADYV
jgi:hypothetical protein